MLTKRHLWYIRNITLIILSILFIAFAQEALMQSHASKKTKKAAVHHKKVAKKVKKVLRKVKTMPLVFFIHKRCGFTMTSDSFFLFFIK